MIDDETVIRFDKTSHYPKSILVNLLFLFVDLFDLHFGFVGEFILCHMVEVGSLD